MKDSRVSKISFIDRVRQAKCYHCGQSSAKSMYRVKYFGPKIIEVCDSCKDRYHKFGNRVVVYVNDNMSADRPYFDDFVSQNMGLIDTIHRVSVDSTSNDGNIIAQALFETVERDGIPTYFAVPSINTFDGIGELVRVINSVRTKNCVFYAHEERIDSSTNEGKSIINTIITAYNMETDRYSRNLKKARDTKRLIKEYGNSDE